MLKLNCIESLTAIGIGVGASALAPLDAGSTAGAVIGGAGLFARIRENLRKPGLEEPDTIRRVQKEVLRDWDHWQNTQERRDAVTLADAAMTRWLPTVMMTREELAATATESGEDDERYPVIAARKIADRLGEHDPSFEAPEGERPEPLARQFAREVIERALRAAKNDRDYATFLTLDIAIELGRATAENGQYLKQIEEKVDSVKTDTTEILAILRAQHVGQDFGDQALRDAIARFIAITPDASRAGILEEIARFERDYRALLEQVGKIQVIDNQVASLKAAAEEALAEPDVDLDRARALYAEAVRVARDKLIEPVRNLAQLRTAEASVALLSRDWAAANVAWADAESMLLPFDETATYAITWQATEKLLEHGTIFGSRGALDAAVARARAMRDRLSGGENFKAFGAWSNWLGLALSEQGERTGGDGGLSLLAEAVTAYRAALTVYNETAMSADWAMAQNNLGTALEAQGMRTGGAAGLTLLADAARAYRATLSVHTESMMPARWAGTLNNLGNVLSTQGEWTGGEAELALLAEAVIAYRAALTVYTETATPTDWAATQNNLGTALRQQCERTGGAAGLALLAEAVTAYRAALTVRTESAMPAQWAMTQNNLGAALEAQGERTGGAAGLALLADAVTAYRAALTILTAEHFGYYHEMAQRNLARTLALIADRTN